MEGYRPLRAIWISGEAVWVRSLLGLAFFPEDVMIWRVPARFYRAVRSSRNTHYCWQVNIPTQPQGHLILNSVPYLAHRPVLHAPQTGVVKLLVPIRLACCASSQLTATRRSAFCNLTRNFFDNYFVQYCTLTILPSLKTSCKTRLECNSEYAL